MRTKEIEIMRYMPTGEKHEIELFEFYELGEEAQERAFNEFVEERANDPYFGQWFADSYEREIWDGVRDLENSIRGARVEWRYNRWYSCDFDVEYSYNDCYHPCELEPVKDNGVCYSMAVCDAWNKHVRKLNAISYQLEHVEHLQADVYPDWGPHYTIIEENVAFYNKLDDIAGNLTDLWFTEIERACDDVRDTIETLLRGEWEYYTSEEYARLEFEDETTQGYKIRTTDHSGRVYFHDCRKWYTADGEFYEQSDINHACISLARVS